VPITLSQLQVDRLPAEQVLDADVAQMADPDLARQHLGDAGQHLELRPHALARLQDA